LVTDLDEPEESNKQLEVFIGQLGSKIAKLSSVRQRGGPEPEFNNFGGTLISLDILRDSRSPFFLLRLAQSPLLQIARDERVM